MIKEAKLAFLYITSCSLVICSSTTTSSIEDSPLPSPYKGYVGRPLVALQTNNNNDFNKRFLIRKLKTRGSPKFLGVHLLQKDKNEIRWKRYPDIAWELEPSLLKESFYLVAAPTDLQGRKSSAVSTATDILSQGSYVGPCDSMNVDSMCFTTKASAFTVKIYKDAKDYWYFQFFNEKTNEIYWIQNDWNRVEFKKERNGGNGSQTPFEIFPYDEKCTTVSYEKRWIFGDYKLRSISKKTNNSKCPLRSDAVTTFYKNQWGVFTSTKASTWE